MDNNLVPKGEVGAMVKIVVGSQRMSTEHKVRGVESEQREQYSAKRAWMNGIEVE